MSDKSLSAMHSQKDEGPREACKKKTEDQERCIKLDLNENLQAFINDIKLEREYVESITCNKIIIDKVILNYIIAKQILSNLDWQDKMICENVCTTWKSAVQSLQKERLSPHDFVIDFHPRVLRTTYFKKSGAFDIEPLVVMTFTNTSGCSISAPCKCIEPKTCQPSCNKDHCLLDVVYQHTSAPKNLMVAIRADYLSYMPLSNSITSKHQIVHLKATPFICGLYIPHIPDVEFHAINIKSQDNLQSDFFGVVDRIATTRIFKGVIVYVTDKYLLHSVDDIIFLNHFKTVQPDIPYALGGCIVDDTVFNRHEINGVIQSINEGKDYISENLLSIAVFTVPKDRNSAECNFDMFSLILDSAEWSKAKIEQSIKEFSMQVPRYEHSVCIKLSCVGRDQKHKFEQDCFRANFPDTRTVGCYGNGELGVNHPAKPERTPDTSVTAKKSRRVGGPDFGIMYSYSSVFVYVGWGKITSPVGPLVK